MCSYFVIFLTILSPSVNFMFSVMLLMLGICFQANVRSYYLKLEEEQTQILIDQKIKERLGQAVAYQQIGAAYNQHLAAFPGQRPRLPMMPPPMLPVPGAMPPQLMAGARPPTLPIPVLGAPGTNPCNLFGDSSIFSATCWYLCLSDFLCFFTVYIEKDNILP